MTRALRAVDPRGESYIKLGRAIRALRAERGISQEELAARSGMDRSYFSSIERGERGVSLGKVLDVAAALGVPASELIRRAEEAAG